MTVCMCERKPYRCSFRTGARAIRYHSVKIGSLRNNHGDINENGKKTIGLDWKNNNLHHAFLFISLPSLHDYDVKMPNFTFCGGREHKATTFFFFFSTSIQSFRIQLQKKNAKIWRIEWDRISEIKFEARRLHFLSDVLVAVGVVVTLLKLPNSLSDFKHSAVCVGLIYTYFFSCLVTRQQRKVIRTLSNDMNLPFCCQIV